MIAQQQHPSALCFDMLESFDLNAVSKAKE